MKPTRFALAVVVALALGSAAGCGGDTANEIDSGSGQRFFENGEGSEDDSGTNACGAEDMLYDGACQVVIDMFEHVDQRRFDLVYDDVNPEQQAIVSEDDFVAWYEKNWETLTGVHLKDLKIVDVGSSQMDIPGVEPCCQGGADVTVRSRWTSDYGVFTETYQVIDAGPEPNWTLVIKEDWLSQMTS